MPLNQKSPISLCEALIRCSARISFFLKYRLIAVDQNLKAEVAVFGNMRSAHPGLSELHPEKESRNGLCGYRDGKTEEQIYSLWFHALIFFVNDQADQTFAIFRELAVF